MTPIPGAQIGQGHEFHGDFATHVASPQAIGHDMTKGTLPPEWEAPEETPLPEPAAPTTMVIWVHDGPVCVTVVDLPPPHVPSGACRCAACLAHDPERALSFL